MARHRGRGTKIVGGTKSSHMKRRHKGGRRKGRGRHKR